MEAGIDGYQIWRTDTRDQSACRITGGGREVDPRSVPRGRPAAGLPGLLKGRGIGFRRRIPHSQRFGNRSRERSATPSPCRLQEARRRNKERCPGSPVLPRSISRDIARSLIRIKLQSLALLIRRQSGFKLAGRVDFLRVSRQMSGTGKSGIPQESLTRCSVRSA